MAGILPDDQRVSSCTLGADSNPNILPEHESPARTYANEHKIGSRPNRERVRGQIADYVVLMLGGPVVDIELDSQQLSLAVDEALRVFEQWAPQEYFQYYTFDTAAGVQVYEMPPDIGMISEVNYLPPESDAAAQLGGSMPLGWIGDTGYGAGGLSWGAWGYNRHQPYWGYAGEWVMFKQYEDMFERLSGRNGGWEFFEDEHKIIIYPTPWYSGAGVTVKYLQRKKDWKEVHQFMNEYALAMAKIMLGRIRSKYSQIVSPGGGATLDGTAILQEGMAEKKQLEHDLVYKWSAPQLPIIIG